MSVLFRETAVALAVVTFVPDLSAAAEKPVSLSVLIRGGYQHTAQFVFRQHISHHLHNCIQDSSRIVPEINDQLLHALRLQILHRILKLLAGHAVKLHHIDITHMIRQHLVLHRGNLDLTPLDIQLYLVVGFAPKYGHLYLAALFPPDVVADQQIQLQTSHIFIVHLIDNVSRQHPRLISRGSLKHLDDRGYPCGAVLGNHGADTAVFSCRIFHQGLIILFIVIHGVGILQPVHQACIDAILHFLHILIKQVILFHDILDITHLFHDPVQLQISL